MMVSDPVLNNEGWRVSEGHDPAPFDAIENDVNLIEHPLDLRNFDYQPNEDHD
jgi:hypothetical protein